MSTEGTLADLFYLFVMGIMPYVSATIFFGGIIYRIADWFRSDQKSQSLELKEPLSIASYATSTTDLAQSQSVGYKKTPSIPRRIVNLVKGIILEIFFLRRVYRGSFKLWLITWPTHIALLGMLIGHARLVIEFTPIWVALHFTESEIEAFSGLTGSIVGVIFIGGITILLLRRLFVKEIREISNLGDYFLLILLLVKGFLGMTMRFIPEAHVSIFNEIRPYFLNMLALNPMPIVANPYFALHLFVAEILLIYLPFSKLIHIISITITQVVRGISK